ncbi:MAG: DUF4345 domain-containing protein [Sphingomonadales bacterium]|jgi:hypothetical protein|nr:DUF4345 domain-containing protein [Sphingomonadales bacterium]MBP7136851.1 DUF4345 domain-containing protein [Sphingomonadaceae bacterium]MBK6490824.1 DUF4345 domain-containing protein [Sphingomonadales bacterium]MBK6719220.1 DUF4345 domain-containing protein [Sphingomonadales bacterium]MBK7284390.1 DUF4345 domain-containing protein [Sphingomonadales bacterium]
MLKLFIRIIAPGFVLAGLLHVFLGLGADVMLGADIPASVLNDASLDSQNRFYGISFTVYGVLLWIASTDLARYRTLLRVLILWFFLGGVMRLVSIALKGWPSNLVWALALSELVLPPVLWWMLRREEKAGQDQPRH